MPWLDADNQKEQRKEKSPLWKHSVIPRKALLSKWSIHTVHFVGARSRRNRKRYEVVLTYGKFQD